MNLHWFKRIGIFFVPIHAAGWVLSAACLVYVVYSFLEIDGRSHSVSDTLINFTFRLLLVIAVYSLIAIAVNRLSKS